MSVELGLVCNKCGNLLKGTVLNDALYVDICDYCYEEKGKRLKEENKKIKEKNKYLKKELDIRTTTVYSLAQEVDNYRKKADNPSEGNRLAEEYARYILGEDDQ